MAKSEGRGWKKYIPSLATIGKVFIASVIIHQVTAVVYPRLPEQAKSYWPRT